MDQPGDEPTPELTGLQTLPYELLAGICEWVVAGSQRREKSVITETDDEGLREPERLFFAECRGGTVAVSEFLLKSNDEENIEPKKGRKDTAARDLTTLMSTCRSLFAPACRTLFNNVPLTVKDPAPYLEALVDTKSPTLPIAAPLVKTLIVRLPLFALRNNEGELAFAGALKKLLTKLDNLRTIEVEGYGDSMWRKEPYYFGFVPFGVVWNGLWDAICAGVSGTGETGSSPSSSSSSSGTCLKADGDEEAIEKDAPSRPAYLDSVKTLSLTALSFQPFTFLRSIAAAFPNLATLSISDCDINAEHLKIVFSGGKPRGLGQLEELTVITDGLHPTLRTDVHPGLPPFLALPSLKSVKLDTQVVSVAPDLFLGLGKAVEKVEVQGELWLWQGGRERAVRAVDWTTMRALRVGEWVYKGVAL